MRGGGPVFDHVDAQIDALVADADRFQSSAIGNESVYVMLALAAERATERRLAIGRELGLSVYLRVLELAAKPDVLDDLKPALLGLQLVDARLQPRDLANAVRADVVTCAFGLRRRGRRFPFQQADAEPGTTDLQRANGDAADLGDFLARGSALDQILDLRDFL